MSRQGWIVGLCIVAIGVSIADRALIHARPQSQTSVIPSTQATPVVGKIGNSLLGGKIVDEAGRPVAGAVVSLGGGLSIVGLNTVVQGPSQVGQRRVLTGTDGRFMFFDLPGGSYSVDATKPGYSAGAYGRLRSGGTAQSFDLANDAQIGNLSVQMWKFASLSGTITDEAGEPAVGMSVTALRRVIDAGRARITANLGGQSATTDDRGMFRLASLLPGQYLLCVASSVTTFPVDLVDAYQQARQDASIAEWSRQMSASGALGVNLLGNGYRVGDAVVQVGSAFGRPSTAPGPSDDGRMAVYPTIFFRGALSASQAETITLGPAEDREGINLQLKLLPAVRVAGAVVGPDGPVSRVGVRLVPTFASDMTNESTFDVGTTITDDRGRFQFLGVPTGPYIIRVLKVPPPVVRLSPPPPNPNVPVTAPPLFINEPLPEGPTLWASQPIVVGDAGSPDVTVMLNRGVHIVGRFQFDGSSPRPAPAVLQSLGMQILRADGRTIGSTAPLFVSVDPAGRISTLEIPPDRYIFRYAASLQAREALGGWLFANATIGGKNVSALPFDLQADVSDLVVTMTDHPTELTGTVRDAQGRPDPASAVLIVSVDRAGWSDYGTNPVLIRTVRPGKDGTYRLVNFVPGEYYGVAIPESQGADWQDPRVLESVVQTAQRFKIAPGEKKTQDLVTRPIR